MSAGIRRRWRAPIRTVDIGTLQDAFLISAVAMILVIRLQLFLTHYPQLGGGRLHIAHLLWGGLFMLIALGILVSFLGRRMRLPAAIVGGIGFGFFIDELGKFITEDNDYFFKPTAAIIYLIFIGLFLITRLMQRRRGFTPRECLVNAIDLLAEAGHRELHAAEKREALELLDRADPDDPMTARVRGLFEELAAAPEPEPHVLQRFALGVRRRYERLVAHRRFAWLLGAFFALWALTSMLSIAVLGLALTLDLGELTVDQVAGDHVSFVNLGSVAASLVVSALVVAGVWRLARGRRLDAYLMFDRALLVQIFVGEFFAFVESEFHAVFGLAFNILLLITVRLMIRGERNMARAEPGGPPEPVARPPVGEPAAA